jgi:hypothetical protein
VAIYNSLGRQVYLKNVVEGALVDVNASGWPDGIYHYVIYANHLPLTRGTICRQQ